MRSSILTSLVGAGVSALAACAHNPAGDGPRTPAASPPVMGTRAAIVDTCTMAGAAPAELGAEMPADPKGPKFMPALLAAILPTLIDKSVDYAAAALKKAGEKSVAVASTTAATTFYGRAPGSGDLELPLAGKCLVVAHGPFGPFDPKGSLDLGRDADIYFEAWIAFSKDASAFRVVPAYLGYGKALESSYFGSERDFQVELTFETPVEVQGKKAFALTIIPFAKVKPGVASKLRGMSSAWLPNPPPAQEVGDALTATRTKLAELRDLRGQLAAAKAGEAAVIGKARAALAKQLEADEPTLVEARLAAKPDTAADIKTEALAAAGRRAASIVAASAAAGRVQEKRDALTRETEIAALDRREKAAAAELARLTQAFPAFGPVTVAVTLRETKNANEFLEFLAGVVEAASPQIQEAAKTALVTANREEARRKEEAAARQAQAEQDRLDQAALIARNAADVEQAKVDSLQPETGAVERTQALNALRLAQLNANIAYRAAGRPLPFPAVTP